VRGVASVSVSALLCAALLSAATLSGCAGLFHSNAQPEQTYYLRAPEAGAAGAIAPLVPPASVRVSHPLASPGLDNAHIMLVQSDHRMNFYAGSRWPSAAPDVVEALITQTLRASGAWSSVEDTASPFPSDYVLQSAVRRFEADYTADAAAPVVYVVIDCILGRGEGREVIATFSVSASSPAAANRLGEVVAAFEQAAHTALGSLAQQAAQAARDDAQRRAQKAERPVPSITRPSQ
jgi:cholesterol transport system auxiliary component